MDKLFSAVKEDTNNSKLIPALTRLLASWHHLPTEIVIENDTANAVLQLSSHSMREHFDDPAEFKVDVDCCTVVSVVHMVQYRNTYVSIYE